VVVESEGALPVCAWCFDLLEIDGVDTRPLPLVPRKRKLASLLHPLDSPFLRYSESFEGADAAYR
jgi:ATP-dependent DNA ligase